MSRAIRGALVLVLAVVGVAVAWSVSADTIERGPYLQQATSSSVIVRWRSQNASDSRVDFGDAPDNLTDSIVVPGSTTEHEVLVDGLLPDTRYYYAVGSSGGILGGGDASHYFATSPVPGSAAHTRVWVVGDSGTANADAVAVRDAYKTTTGSQATDLWLMLGDNAYPDGTQDQYQDAVFEIYPELLRHTVLWPTLGNHDGISADSSSQTGAYYDIFTLPKFAEAGGVASGTEAYYSFDYGQVHFISLDSHETDRAPGGPMLTWLEQDLAANTSDWTVVFWHHPPYTKGSHDSDTESRLIEMRENVLPILESYGVDVVLTGHSHSYERSHLLDGHYETSDQLDEVTMILDDGGGREDGNGAYAKGPDSVNSGAVYAVAGSSGKISGGPLNHPAMFISLNSLGSMILEVYADRFDAAFLNENGAVTDHFTILKGADTTAPEILAVDGVDPTTVEIVYTEPLEGTSAVDLANYAIDQGVAVLQADLSADGRKVTLTTTAMADGTSYLLSVADVADPNGNIIDPGTQVDFVGVNELTISFRDGVLPSPAYAGTRDASIAEDTPNTAKGGETSLFLDGSDPAGTDLDVATLMQWDLSAIPSGSVIKKASITIEVTNVSGDLYEIYQLARDWDEASVTWNQAQSGINWGSPGAEAGSDRTGGSLGHLTGATLGGHEFALNQDGIAVVQSWIDDAGSNHGFIVSDTLASNGLDFTSREGATADARPMLTVTYGAQTVASALVQDVSLALLNSGNHWRRATAQVLVEDEDGLPVPGATVSGDWGGLVTGSVSADTGADGTVTFESERFPQSLSGEVSFAVTDVDAANLSYDPSASAVTQGCITTDGAAACGGPGGEGALMQVSALDVVVVETGKRWSGRATVTVVDIDGGNAPVANATVTGNWIFQEVGGAVFDLGGASDTTDGSGLAVITSPKRKAAAGDSFTFEITGVVLSGSSFDDGGISSGVAVVPAP